MAETPVRMLTGTIVVDDYEPDSLYVNVNGSTVNAAFMGSYTPAENDLVRVLIIDGIATVLGPIFPTARAAVGTVASVADGIASVLIGDTTVSARFVGTAPESGNLVRLDWSGSQPWILGIPGTEVAPDPGTLDNTKSNPKPPAPKSKPKSGTLTIPAGWSGSWRPSPYSKWESGDVRQGAYGSGVGYEGVWGGYSQARLKSLSGKTITRVQIRLGSRLRLGNYNSTLRLYFYRSKPTGKGDPNQSSAQFWADIPANSGNRWVTLPNAFGDALVYGGTVTIQGGAYGGVVGRSRYAYSGTLKISWRD